MLETISNIKDVLIPKKIDNNRQTINTFYFRKNDNLYYLHIVFIKDKHAIVDRSRVSIYEWNNRDWNELVSYKMEEFMPEYEEALISFDKTKEAKKSAAQIEELNLQNLLDDIYTKGKYVISEL